MNNFNVFKIKINDFLVDNKLKAIEISKNYLKDMDYHIQLFPY